MRLYKTKIKYRHPLKLVRATLPGAEYFAFECIHSNIFALVGISCISFPTDKSIKNALVGRKLLINTDLLVLIKHALFNSWTILTRSISSTPNDYQQILTNYISHLNIQWYTCYLLDSANAIFLFSCSNFSRVLKNEWNYQSLCAEQDEQTFWISALWYLPQIKRTELSGRL